MGDLWEKDIEVLEFVKSNHDCSLSDIIHGVTSFTEHTIIATVRHLVRIGLLKQKEDPIDHDWVYRVKLDGEESDGSPDSV